MNASCLQHIENIKQKRRLKVSFLFYSFLSHFVQIKSKISIQSQSDYKILTDHKNMHHQKPVSVILIF